MGGCGWERRRRRRREEEKRKKREREWWRREEEEGRDNGRRRRTEETRADLEQTANDAPPPTGKKKNHQKIQENSQRGSQQCKTRLWLFRIWSSRKHSVRLSRKLRPRCDAMRWRCDARKRTRGATGKCNVEAIDTIESGDSVDRQQRNRRGQQIAVVALQNPIEWNTTASTAGNAPMLV